MLPRCLLSLGARFRARSVVLACVALTASACGGNPSVTNSDQGTKPDGGTSSTGGTGNGATGNIGIGVGGGDGSGEEMGGAPAAPDAVCGNGKVEAGELCDDGNTDDNDGCSADCVTIDPDYFCTEGQLCVRVVTCGNGVIEGDEACDDGNTMGSDGCAADCASVEDGYACPKPNEACVGLPDCGNGLREKGEQCDDGNVDSADGCSDQCELEQGYFCPPGKKCLEILCGNGVRTPDEQCDDGGTANGDGCSSTCTIEDGWLCSASGCRPICGDSKVLGSEACDDGGTKSGDGCSSACKVEPFYSCNQAQPSVCTSTIVCGDGVLSPGEVCDPGIVGEGACYGPAKGEPLACKGYDTGLVDPPVCNNGVVEYMEECDGAVTGCTNCKIDAGYVCPAASVCFKLPVCGDGTLQAGEECDLGLISGPGCTGCKIDPNYFCSGQPSVCVASVCGDGTRAPNEACDDHNNNNGDGCSSTCTIETGWSCPPGSACQPICGDGQRKGNEQCDTPDTAACTNCRLNPGYTCGAGGTANPCTKTVCGNATTPVDPAGSANYIATAKAAAEPGEGCDDGNAVAGDGCGPTCQLEPQVTVGPSPIVAVTCGDGLKTGAEQCDDGNTTSGDGCSSTCKVESGWACDSNATYPDSVAFRVVYRDFKQRNVAGGHPHMKANGSGATAGYPNGGGTPDNSPAQGNDGGIVGTVCTAANAGTCGRLDAQGKPAYVGGTHLTIDTDGDGANLDETYHKAAFALWYRDSNAAGTLDPTSQASGGNTKIDVSVNPATVPAGGDRITLTKTAATGQPAVKASYRFSSGSFFPVDGRGYGNTAGQSHNFQFTSELRYFFQYQGGETLTFFGDDDVFVFINGRLAVDIGGIHGQLNGRVVLGDDGDGAGNQDSNCSIQIANNNNQATPAACTLEANEDNGDDTRFGLTKGGVYEIVVFQAERHPTGSNYQLTLDGFIAPRSFCHTTCGDGIRAGTELCDDGANMPASGYNVCLKTCTVQFCGDGVKNGGEACDDHVNSTLYGTSGCAPGCVLPSKCGDGSLQANFGEECDKGNANANGAYGGCTTSCKLGPYCGDGTVSNGETCDTPGQFTTYADGPGKCNYNCKQAPYCGDGIRNGAEICDGTPNCNANCELDPFCGDGLKESGEECDYGPFGFDGSPASAPYGGCTTMCKLGPYCGDDKVQSGGGEECDNGGNNADNVYDGCTSACLLGPHCGDAVLQAGAGEVCDNGFNEDNYAYPGDNNACGPDCMAVPYCGDGALQSAFELCDNGNKNNDTAYNGCTTSCDFGPYCGDGKKNGPEDCDDGPKNTPYAADGKGCGFDCKRAPYCGDGVRSGPEQCDLGESKNTGEYGGCNADCTRAPYCGDRKVNKSQGEECDDGANGSLTCTPACKRRRDVPK